MEYILDVDSGERDAGSNINDYNINLNRSLYDVSNFKLISGRIPMSQPTIHDFNNTFFLDGEEITIPKGEYTDIAVLAAAIETAIDKSGFTVTPVTPNIEFSHTDSFTLDFSGSGLAPLLGFDYTSYTGTTVESTLNVNLDDPNSLIIRISSSGDIMKKEVYKDEFDGNYTGRIILKQRKDEIVNFNGNSDPIEYKFHEGNWSSLDHIRIEFFYGAGSRLIPYDFNGKNHALKFIIRGHTDRRYTFKGVPDIDIPPPPVSTDEIVSTMENGKIDTIYIIIGSALLLTLGFLLFKPQRHTLAPKGP